MVAYNFEKQFADEVEYGKKLGTIRLKDRCKVGDKLQLYTAQRTKACWLLRETVCWRVRPISIYPTHMFLGGKQLIAGLAPRGDLEDRDCDFAAKDGFRGFIEMADWFEKKYKALPIHGFYIEWAAL